MKQTGEILQTVSGEHDEIISVLECPFCGSTSNGFRADVDDDPDEEYVTCEDCGATGPKSFRKVTAAMLWNTRVK